MNALIEEVAHSLHDFQRRVGVRPDLIPQADWHDEPTSVRTHYRNAAFVVMGAVGPPPRRRSGIGTWFSKWWERNVSDEYPWKDAM